MPGKGPRPKDLDRLARQEGEGSSRRPDDVCRRAGGAAAAACPVCAG